MLLPIPLTLILLQAGELTMEYESRRAIPALHLLQYSGEWAPATYLGSIIHQDLDVEVSGELALKI